jgi:hypothetical protein
MSLNRFALAASAAMLCGAAGAAPLNIVGPSPSNNYGAG